MLRRLRPSRADLAALGAGALLPLAFAPFRLFPIALLAPALLFLLWRGATPRAAFRRGFLFGVGQFGVGVSWVYVAIHDFGYTGMPLALLLTALFVAVLALYPASLGYLAGRLQRRLSGVAEGTWLLALLPALWVLFEWWRGWFLTGFPWLDLGYSQIGTPLAGLAPWLGVYGISLAAAVSAGALAYAQRGGWRVALPVLLLVWGGAWAAGQVRWAEPAGKPLRVKLVQGNLPQITKWDSEQIKRRLDTYATLTLPILKGSDLVVWPENAVTVFYDELKADYFDWLGQKAREAGSELLVGVPVIDRKSGRYYTTLTSVGVTPGSYRKRHLVPFGEFVPLQGLLRGLIRFFDLPMSAFTPGPADQPPLMLAGQPAAASICYEDAFGSEVIHDLPRATLLVNGSNTAWFGDSLAPHQQFDIARMRALETRRPLVLATTTGVSALVGPLGEVIARAPQFRTTVLGGTIQPMSGATPYVLWGNRAVLALLAALLLVPLARRLARRKAMLHEAVSTEGGNDG